MLKEWAQTELDQLEQGLKTIEEYNAEAAILFADAEIENEEETIRIYRKGLKKAIQQRIEEMTKRLRQIKSVIWYLNHAGYNMRSIERTSVSTRCLQRASACQITHISYCEIYIAKEMTHTSPRMHDKGFHEKNHYCNTSPSNWHLTT